MSIIEFVGTTEVPKFDHARRRLPSPDGAGFTLTYVLSSADFGRAYLSEAWATNFIRKLLERYTVVMVGYQAEDPPVKYLLQGLNHDGNFDRSKLYAFDRGRPEDIEAKWRDRGVTAIAYSDHSHLWATIEAWAIRSDDPRKWRANVVNSTLSNPKELAPYQRGQVAHVLRSVQGAKLFAGLDPKPHPEWICVLDGFIRSGKEYSGDGEDSESFDPYSAYGLDDDREKITADDYKKGIRNDNLLEWKRGDDNPPDCHSLGSRQVRGQEALPSRLKHLVSWIANSLESPVIAWWAVRKNGLHPNLVSQIEFWMGREPAMDGRALSCWNLILEHHRDSRNREWDGSWFELKRKIAREGWSPSVLRDFGRAFHPRLMITPSNGVSLSRPPLKGWMDTNLHEIGQFEVKLLELHGEGLEVPDEMLVKVLTILENRLGLAADMLNEAGISYYPIPTFYPGRRIDGETYHSEVAEVLKLFVELYDRLADLNPDVANARAMAWDSNEAYFFRKLKLYALSKPKVFTADQVIEVLMGIEQDAFWDLEVARELLFLVQDRWAELSDAGKNRLSERLVLGPDQRSYWTDEEYPVFRAEMAARYTRYLEMNGCALPKSQAQKLAEILVTLPDWNDGWAASTVTERGVHSGWVQVDETPDSILDLPLSEIVVGVETGTNKSISRLTEKRPFTGLVKINPRKALAALTAAGRAGRYPAALWSTLINEMPQSISPRLKQAFIGRLAKLPASIVAELRHPLGRWLAKNFSDALALDNELGWTLYDNIVVGLLSEGPEALKSGLGDIRRGGSTSERSRNTYSHALNGPLGMCAEALLLAISSAPVEDGMIPLHIASRLERLFTVGGEGANHAVSICMSQFDWLIRIDPDWTKSRLLPMLSPNKELREAAWSGLLHARGLPSEHWAPLLKPLLLDVYPWVESLAWPSEEVIRPAQWLAWMRVFAKEGAHGVTTKEMRNVLRKLSDSLRCQVINWLGRVGQKNDKGWVDHVIPFVESVWPLERRFRTEASSMSWIRLLDDTANDFPLVFTAIKKFLVPIEGEGHFLYRFTRDVPGNDLITTRHPEATLDFLNIVTPQRLVFPLHELPAVLTLIADSKPELVVDPRYLRLIDLVERY